MAEMTATGSAARGDVAAAVNRSSLLPWTAASALMLLALLAPAMWNGFPLIFPDTGGYLERPIEGTLDLGRSALYGLFVYAGVPFAFWPVIIAQSALTAWLVALGLRAYGLGGRPWLALGIVTLLAVATSLPWMAGQLLPDILFPAAVLSLHVLAFRLDRLARWERGVLAGVIAVAIASHMAAAGLCVGLLVLLWLAARAPLFNLPRPRLTMATVSVAAGIALCPLSNWAIAGSFTFTPGGPSFLFGRLAEDGIVQRYLAERCPDPALKLCAYQADMPDDGDDWLWDPNSPYRKLGGWRAIEDEERAVILASLARYPLLHAVTALNATFQQFISLRTEVSLDDNAPTLETFARFVPQAMPALMAARQQQGAIDVDAINALHVPVAALAIAAVAGALAFRRQLRLAPQLAAFCATVLLALLVNAAICGIFSHPVDRYQSRLAPLALFAVLLVAVSRRNARLGPDGKMT